jgi:chromate transporter
LKQVFDRETAWEFFKLGLTVFGGPAAHLAAFEKEFVQKRGWISQEEFRAHFAVSNLLPGPTSTEMAMAIGFHRKGWAGFFSAGIAFLLPAVVLVVLILAVLPLDSPSVTQFALGASPVLAAILVKASWDLFRRTNAPARPWWAAGIAFSLHVFGFSQWSALCLSGSLVLGRARLYRFAAIALSFLFVPWFFAQLTPSSFGSSPTLTGVFSVFSYLGTVVFGSGYVLLGFFDQVLHRDLGWLSSKQVVWTSLVAQVTPGPLFAAATGAGFLMKSWLGALMATVGIFLPAFVFSALAAVFHRKLMANFAARMVADVLALVSLLFLALSVVYLFPTLVAGWLSWCIFLFSCALLFKGAPGGWILIISGILTVVF